DGLFVGQKEPLGREHDPCLPDFVEAELCMRGQAQDVTALDRQARLPGHGVVRPGTNAPGGVSAG
ncbi:MAG TPA: hypothetical protein VHT00_19870, partial [Stellaceae bacterium]|nr:hypothetical protein [Stellaceae bacterium]